MAITYSQAQYEQAVRDIKETYKSDVDDLREQNALLKTQLATRPQGGSSGGPGPGDISSLRQTLGTFQSILTCLVPSFKIETDPNSLKFGGRRQPRRRLK